MQGGLHARPCADVTKVAMEYKSEITMTLQDRKIHVKSVIEMMNLDAEQGDEILVSAEGEDEVEAVLAVIHVIEHLE